MTTQQQPRVATPPEVHPTAQVDPRAKLGAGVKVDAYAVIGPHVTIGDGTWIGPHAVIDGWTVMGCDNKVYPGAVIGTAPQDISYKGEEAWVHIGDRNTFREYVTVNRANNHMGATVIGNDNLMMTCTHVAHNCCLGNGIIMTNYSGFAGHCQVEDYVVLGGLAGVHQFVRVGTMAMIGGAAKVIKDIPPYSKVDGQPARIYGLNDIGLRRRGVKSEVRRELRKAFRLLTRSKMALPEAIETARQEVAEGPEIQHLLAFMGLKSKMGVLMRYAEKSGNGNGRVHRGGDDGGDE